MPPLAAFLTALVVSIPTGIFAPSALVTIYGGLVDQESPNVPVARAVAAPPPVARQLAPSPHPAQAIKPVPPRPCAPCDIPSWIGTDLLDLDPAGSNARCSKIQDMMSRNECLRGEQRAYDFAKLLWRRASDQTKRECNYYGASTRSYLPYEECLPSRMQMDEYYSQAPVQFHR